MRVLKCFLLLSSFLLCVTPVCAQDRETIIRARLGAFGIDVNDWSPPLRTEVGGLLESTIIQLIKFQHEYGRPLVVTGGNETWIHSDEPFGHHYGWKVDLRISDPVPTNDPLSRYIIGHYIFVGYRSGTDAMYKSSTGALFTLEICLPDRIRFCPGAPHWDVYFPIKLRVTPPEPVQVKMGQSVQLVAEALEENDSDLGLQPEDFNWSSSDSNVASVDPRGTIRGLKEGSVGIFVAQGIIHVVNVVITKPDPPPPSPGGT
jgi:Big-like domain-containing protein